MTRYVFHAKDQLRYRFPTHTNDLLLDRAEAETAEAFMVVLEPGEAPPLHAHHDTEQVFYVLVGPATCRLARRRVSGFRSGRGTWCASPGIRYTGFSVSPACRCAISASIVSQAAGQRTSQPGRATCA